ncbi:2', 3'-cyclic nucleotide 2'-phosphodiesterase [Haloarcula hispanica N601]|uniref:2', 3'-cyclic nucleotide 2'-phosphodiesterase n=3 Tax=Haloarcula hispanica TaxID=51589 RepID=V5THI3_HALHI|nr:5'-nucleotidase C-terminal domain-containing protein [Haloarcula hispanica]AEM55912.1 2',3'-cyclic-nucleotide 2'-phosphodiesterase [Haloarcula hispanica ATCC 33960]AHB64736.1 2', 3'-cyclic nucleotide 2'-phosphodiesterase [Haloarcula hispanica N601]MCJ0620657.1 5'-nucleotidase C-terminal domain-containing protein [Haloarcula hispanica]RYJ11031.1 bifunctional metallophosphatase/5'-nucleotidase [Haloarcula hispanica]
MYAVSRSNKEDLEAASADRSENDTTNTPVDRRKFLSATAALGVAGIAGCASSSDNGTEQTDEASTDAEETTTSSGTAESTSEPATGEVTLVHDTHVHGSYGDLEEAANIATYFDLMNQIADNNDHSIKVGSGDDLATSILSAQFDGKHIVDAFNEGGLEFDTFGNHDFDRGPDVLRDRISDSEFQWVSANARNAQTGDVFGAEQGASQYELVSAGDVTVGLTGIINVEAPTITTMGETTEVPGLEAPVEEVVTEMRDDGADLVVVLSHVASPAAVELAESVDGIDAIVGDHAATFSEEPQVVNDTVLSFVDDEYDYLGELTLTVEDGERTDHSLTVYDTAAAVDEGRVEPHPGVFEVAESYESKLSDELDVVIGETTVPLDAREDTVRSEESNFGNYIADALRSHGNADVAIQNGGGIRTDELYPEGDITRRMVYSVLPFGNNQVTIEVTGETLVEALELSSTGGGGFLQVSGMRYTYDPDKSKGDRVTEVTVGGEPLDTEATYTVATNGFTATGGDSYTMFQDAPRIIDANEGELLSVIVEDAIEEDGTISPSVEGRIKTE